MTSMNDTFVPVYRASLPTADRLLPYLRIIDEAHHYANRGALVCQLEERLGALIAGSGCAVMSASCGTTALQAAILAQAGRATTARPYAMIPGHTFVATAMAAEACGYQPVFVDVDAEDWMMDALALRKHNLLDQAGIVIPVAPYGRVPAQAAWSDFARDTGIPVVIDAAASFEALTTIAGAGDIPVVLSFHATKAFSTGEGGAVIWSDIDGLARIAQALNFGFLYSRQSRSAGLNGKMSEYHAAVGLAGLDAWPATAERYRLVQQTYHAAAAAAGLADKLLTGPTIAANYALFHADTTDEATAIATALTDARIEHRFWYGQGVHREPYFAAQGPMSLPNTENLAAHLIGIPVFPDIEPQAIDAIVRCLAETVRNHG